MVVTACYSEMVDTMWFFETVLVQYFGESGSYRIIHKWYSRYETNVVVNVAIQWSHKTST